jgi:hypothetical protein
MFSTECLILYLISIYMTCVFIIYICNICIQASSATKSSIICCNELQDLTSPIPLSPLNNENETASDNDGEEDQEKNSQGNLYICICMYICECIYMYMYEYMCTCIYIYMSICVYV